MKKLKFLKGTFERVIKRKPPEIQKRVYTDINNFYKNLLFQLERVPDVPVKKESTKGDLSASFSEP